MVVGANIFSVTICIVLVVLDVAFLCICFGEINVEFNELLTLDSIQDLLGNLHLPKDSYLYILTPKIPVNVTSPNNTLVILFI